MKDKKIQTIPVIFENFKEIDDRFLEVKIYILHTGLNKKNTYFEKSVVNDCIESIYDTPILGFVKIDNSNEKDFEGHKNILVVEDGEYKIKYAGAAWGTISRNCNPRWEFRNCDDGIQREFLVVDGILWKKFDDSIEIMEKDGIKSQSMELSDSFMGDYDDNDVFHFKKFSFFGACILGNSRTPAMHNSTIEVKFSLEDFQQEIQSQMELLKLTLNQQQIELSTENFSLDINTQTKGGKKLNKEKFLELLSKYSNLKEEDCKDILTSLETYSLEDLDTKLKELSEAKTAEFELTQQQLAQSLMTALNPEPKVDDWGWQVYDYYYVDHYTNIIIAYDSEWHLVGFNFTMNGDIPIIDFNSKSIRKLDYPILEGANVEFTLIPKAKMEYEKNVLTKQFEKQISDLKKELEFAEDDLDVDGMMDEMMDEMSSNMAEEMKSAMKISVDKMKTKLKKGMKDKSMMSLEDSQEYKDLQAKFTLIESENSELQSKFSAIETENSELQTKFSDLETEKTELQTKVSEFETINAELKAFQETTLTTQRSEAENELFEMFSEKLTEEELKPFKETAKDFSIEQLKEKLYAVVGQKIAQFELTKTKKPKVNIVFDRNNIEIATGKPYDDIVSQYVASKQ